MLIVWTAIIAFSIIACTKEGPQGNPGTANVIYSDWNNSLSGNSATWIVPQLTQEIMNQGTVLVYGKDNRGLVYSGSVFQLPYTAPGGFFMGVVFDVGKITIHTSDNLSSYSFRYILIPGGTP